MEKRFKKVLAASLIVLVAFILLPGVLFLVCWEIDHRARLLEEVSNPPYSVFIFYYPGGMGTNPEIRVFARSDTGSRQLLLYADARDTSSAFFADMVTVGVVLYDREMREPWSRYPRDTFFFNLSKPIRAIELH